MKKILLSLIALYLSNFVFAQTNIFPTTGSVGIGTTSPNDLFQIGSSKAISFHAGGNKAMSWNAYYNSGQWKYMSTDFASQLYMDYGSNLFQINYATSGIAGDALTWINALTIKDNGNVGIGTASPDNTLHVEGDLLLDVYGNSGHEKGIFFREGFSTTNKYNISILAYDHNTGVSSPDGISINGYDGISFNTGSNARNERMRVAQNGNVGIGTTSPLSKLEIKDSQDASFNSGLGITRSAASQTGYLNMVGGAFNLNSPDGLPIKFRDGGNTNLTIQGDGKVGIGDTNPGDGISPDTNRKLMVNGGITVGYGKRISYDKDYYVHGYSSYDVSLHAEARFRHYGFYGVAIQSRNGSLVLRGDNGNVGIGTTSPTEKLSVDGTVLAKKVRVSVTAADWPDYVFAPSFKLQTLSELEAYIKQNQHLPEVPSAKEVSDNGLDLGDMDATLLKKVEELTLYLIQENKDKEALKKENMALKNTLEEVLKRLEKLEKG